MPELYIITGSNGAGKSSIGPDYIPAPINTSVFDGDKLYMQKQSEFWNSGIKSHKECKKLAIEFVKNTFQTLVDSALEKNEDMAYEGHFTNNATWEIPQQFKDAGYQIHLIFFGLKDTALSELRVVGRTNEGGHYVDPATIKDNFYGNLEKLDIYFPIFDSVTLVDTSGTEHIWLAVIEKGIVVSALPLAELPAWFTTNLPNISRLIRGTSD